MSFRENLIKARSHFVFLAALGCGLFLVMTLEKIEVEPTNIAAITEADLSPPAETFSLMSEFEDITPLPLAVVGKSTPQDLAYGRSLGSISSITPMPRRAL